MQETACSWSISPEEDKSVTNCLHRHEEEYIAHLSPCVSWSLWTNLQHIVWTRDIRVSLYVKGLQEVQDYSVALWQTYGVITLTHGGVRVWVARTGQNPRQRGQHLAEAWHCREDSHFQACFRYCAQFSLFEPLYVTWKYWWTGVICATTQNWLWKSYCKEENNSSVSIGTFTGIINNGIHLGLHYCAGKGAYVVNKLVLQRGWVPIIHTISTICRQIIIFAYSLHDLFCHPFSCGI